MTAIKRSHQAQRVWLSSTRAAKHTGLSTFRLYTIAYHGGIKVQRFGWRWLFQIEPSWRTGEDIYRSYLSSIKKWDHSLVWAHKAIRAAANLPDGFPWPESLDDFVIEQQGPNLITQRELSAYFIIPESERADHRDRILARLYDQLSRGRVHTKRGECSLDVVLERFPDLKLPETVAVDRELGDADERWLWSAMKRQHITKFACAAQILAAGADGSVTRRLGLGLEFLDDKLTELGAGHPVKAQELSAALHSIVDDAITKKEREAARCDGVRALLVMLRALRVYRTRNPGWLDEIAHLLERCIHNDVKLRRDLNALSKDLRSRGMFNRKRDAVDLSDKFLEYSLSISNRAFEAGICALQVEAAERLAREHFDLFKKGEREQPFFQFYAAIPVSNPDGTPVVGARQLACLRLWREADLWQSFSRDQDTLPNWCGLSAEDRRKLSDTAYIYKPLNTLIGPKCDKDDLVVEYVNCIPDIGERVSEPHFVKPYRLGIVAGSDSCPPHLREERLNYISEVMRSPSHSTMGPVGWEPDEVGLAYWSARLGRCIIPIQRFAIGMRMAHCAVSIVRDSMARKMELLQLQQTSECMKVGIGPTGQSYGFVAVPKQRRQVEEFLLSEETFVQCAQLARNIAVASGFSDGYLPDVDAERSVPRRLRQRGPYLFQWQGKRLRDESLAFLIALLSAGHGRVTLHIIRHAAANNLRENDVVIEALQQLLKHQRRFMTEYYARPTPAQVAKKLAASEAEQTRRVREAEERMKRKG
jgi:hypothetical protein